MDDKLKLAIEIADKCRKQLAGLGFHTFIIVTDGKPCATSFITSTIEGAFDKSEIMEMLVRNIIITEKNGTEQGTKEVLEVLTDIIENIQEIKRQCDESIGKE